MNRVLPDQVFGQLGADLVLDEHMLAQMELTLIIARLTQRLDVAAVGTEVPRPVGMVVSRPEGGAPMRVSARDTGHVGVRS